MLITLRVYGHIIRTLLIVSFVGAVLANVGCSRPMIRVENKTPLTLNLSGSERVEFFQIVTGDSVVWRIGPKERQSLSDIGKIVYGEIPQLCLQTIPRNGPPPPLQEGVVYSATAVIFDSGPVIIRFSVRDGTVVQSR